MPNEGNNIAQIMGTLGLNYTPAIQSGQLFARSLETVNAQLSRLQVLSSGTAMSAGLASDFARSKVIVDQYGRELLRVQAETGRIISEGSEKINKDQTNLLGTRQRINDMFFQREQANYDRHLTQLGGKEKISMDRRLALEAQYYAKAERNARNFFQQQTGNMGQLADQMDRRFGWFASSLVFFGSGMVFSNLLKQIGNVEMGMTQIARVTEDTTASFSLMRDELFGLAKDYGTQMSTVQDIALRWAQAGYNVKDTLELTKTSLLALNTAELNAEQSTQALIGIMAQWGLQASDTQLAIDKINKTADDFAVSSQDLVDGLLRSSGAARAMGMSFDQLLGILTATREASGRTGREVGNAVNSILSYMQRPTAIKTFEKMGIKVFANEARTEFRNVIEILGELSSKWDDASESAREGFVKAADEAGLYNEEMATALDAQEEWTDLQKRDLSQAAAGVYRRNYLIALLRNFAQVQDVVNNLTDAAGYSLKENERTMETYQKKVEALKAAMTELAVAIGEAGLLGLMKDLVDGTKGAVDSFNELPLPVRNAIILFLELGAAIGIANLAMRTFTGAGFGYMLIGLAARISGVSAATMGLGTAMKVLAGNPITWVIGGLAAAAIALNQYQKYQEQVIQESIDLAIKSKDQAEKVSTLSKEYDKLSAEMKDGKDVHSQLQQTMQSIAEIFPDVVNGWDSQGRAISINNELLARNIELARQSAIENAKAGYSSAIKKLQKIGEEQDDLNKPYTISTIEGQEVEIPDAALDSDVARRRAERAKELAKERATLMSEIAQLTSVLYDEDQEYGLIGAALSGRVTTTPSANKKSPSGGGDGKTTSADQLRESANEAKLAMTEYNNALQLTDSFLQGITTRERIFDMQLSKETVPTLEQTRQKYTFVAQTIALNTTKQEQLHKAADAARAQLADLNAQMDSLIQQHDAGTISAKNFNTAVGALRPTIQQLENQVAQYGNAWWEAEYNSKAAIQSMKTFYLDALKEQKDAIDEAYNDRLKQIEDEIDAEDKLTKTKTDNKEEEITAIEDETNAQIAAIQALMDALEGEGTQSDREEAEREHNKKMAELLEQKQYHELRTGIEHQDAIDDINKQMAEEDHAWEIKKQEWARDDQRDEYQDQIDAIREQADLRKDAIRDEIDDIKEASEDKKKELQDYYEEVQELLSDKTLDMIATLATSNEDWYQDGVTKMERWAQGLRDGSMEIEDVLSEIQDFVGGAEDERDRSSGSGSSGGGSGGGSGGSKDPSDMTWQELLSYYPTHKMEAQQEINRAGQIYNQKLSARDIEGAGAAHHWANQIKEAIGQKATYDENTASSSYHGYAKGGPIMYDQIAQIHAGEYVLSAQVVDAIRMMKPLPTNIGGGLISTSGPKTGEAYSMALFDRAADRIISAILNSPRVVRFDALLRADNVEYGDGQDIDIHSRSLARAANSIMAAKGA